MYSYLIVNECVSKIAIRFLSVPVSPWPTSITAQAVCPSRCTVTVQRRRVRFTKPGIWQNFGICRRSTSVKIINTVWAQPCIDTPPILSFTHAEISYRE